MRSLIAVVFCSLSLAFATQVNAKEYYKWVDDDGVTHYTVVAPKDRPSELVRVMGGGKTAAGKSNAAPASKALPGDETGFGAPKPKPAAEKAEAKMSVVDPARCEIARNNIQTLTNHPRIRITEADGSIRYLTDEEKAEKMAEAEAAVRESCE